MSFSSDYTLWDWGKRKIDINISELNVQNADEAHSAEARRIKLTVLDRYVRIKILENALAILTVEMGVSEQRKDAVLQLIEEGSRSKRDLLEVELQIKNEELLKLESLASLRAEKSAIKVLLGIDDTDFIELEDIDFDSTRQGSRESFISEHPEMRMLDLDAAVLQKQIQKEERNLLPDLRLAMSVGSNFSSRGRRTDGFSTQILYQDYLLNGEMIALGQEQRIPNFSDVPYGSQVRDNINFSISMGFYVPIFDRGANKVNVAKRRIESEITDLRRKGTEKRLYQLFDERILAIENQIQIIDTFREAIKIEQQLFDMATEERELDKLNGYEWRELKSNLQLKKMKLLEYQAQIYFSRASIAFL